MADPNDDVWKALADPTRRAILDLLRDGPRRTTEIVDAFPQMTRFGVMKHLDVLRSANLVITRAEGRERFNALNAVPIRQIYERWVSRYADLWAHGLLRVKEIAEATPNASAAEGETGMNAQTPRAPREERQGQAEGRE